MTASQARTVALRDCTNNRGLGYGSSAASERVDYAALDLADSPRPLLESKIAPCQDQFTNSTALLDGRLPRTGAENEAPGGSDDGTPYHSSSPKPTDIQCTEDRPHAKPRAVPYKPDLRSANRTNGTTLATISEQGSHSTLHSGRSLPNGHGRHAPVRLVHDLAQTGARMRRSSRLEIGPLHAVPEEEYRNQVLSKNNQMYALIGERRETWDPMSHAAASIKTNSHARQVAEAFQFQSAECALESRGVRGFLQGLLQSVRGVSPHSRPRPSSMESLSLSEALRHRSAAAEGDLPRSHDLDGGCTSHRSIMHAAWAPAGHDGSLSSFPRSCIQSHQRNPRVTVTQAQPATPHSIPITGLPPSPIRPENKLTSAPFLSQTPYVSPQPSKGSGSPATVTTAGALENGLPGTQPLSARTRDDSPIRYTFDGVLLYRSDAPSLYEYDRTRNVSFCSTDSTNYSGTILGIDLDLQQECSKIHQSVPPTRHFSQPSDVEVGPSVSNDMHKPNTTTKLKSTPHLSITSSALPVLLPLAAASGIVRPNHSTPQISFYSPSGNLIQAEDSSLSSVDSCYHNTVPSPPESHARPSLLPATTPSAVPLPKQLQLRHHRYARSDIIPQNVTPSSVQGCDGIVRSRSLQPRSGVKRSLTHAGTRSSSNRFYSPAASRSTSRWRAVASCPKVPKWNSRRMQGSESLGPVTGWTLRVCFCQPFDGVGADTDCLGHDCDVHEQGTHEPLENVRVVSGISVGGKNGVVGSG
ncbi:hypothetical protein CC78DRAFT_224260 [Lojkania enalia]|uniref:Uncharacterized protein n=1 Tax=Lojkania enalia TaxID=147567 RepID=A0A9P4KAD9_9PLEO|nr:hypothetical protein CC78DRAFT_224260 [Didymosphaeria enalia]